jgi:peptidoglycan/LPS O-acetylase OafA/YrhL
LGSDGWIRILTSFDPVAGGVLLALLLPVAPVQEVLCSKSAGLIAILFVLSPLEFGAEYGLSESYRLLLIPALATLVAAAWQGMTGPIGWLLEHPVSVFVNRISYGAYLYHLPLWWLVGQVYPDIFRPGPLPFAVMSLLAMGVATLSWYGVECHFAALKRRFPTKLPVRQPFDMLPADLSTEQPAE